MLTRYLAGAAAALALLTAAPAASAQSGGSAAPGNVTNLHQAYLASLPSARSAPISGVVYPRGSRRPAAARAAGCNQPNCALKYHGGPVQRHPHIYLLLWGPQWKRDPAQAQTAAYLKAFYKGLGRQPKDTWSTITSQFGSRAGYPEFKRTVFNGVFHDMSRPPRHTRQRQFAAEANAFARKHHIRDHRDAQVVIATQSGTCPAGFQSASVCGNSVGYCAWHSRSRVPYTNLPYLLDAGAACGQGQEGQNLAGFSIVGGHEYAETVTDPNPGRGWWDRGDPSGGEIGDKCAWTDPVSGAPDTGLVNLATGTFAVQPLFSDIALARTGDGCTLSSPAGGRITGARHKCLGAIGGSRIGVASCDGKVGEFWSRGGSDALSVYGLCLTAGAKGALVTAATCVGAPAQQWVRHRREYKLNGTRLCLTAGRKKVTTATCRNRGNQHWQATFKV